MKRKRNGGKVRADVPLEALPSPDEVLREVPHEDAQEASPDATPTQLLNHLIDCLESEVAELRPKVVKRDMLIALVYELRVEWDRWAAQVERMTLALIGAARTRQHVLIGEGNELPCVRLSSRRTSEI